jgi:hypothetical protein
MPLIINCYKSQEATPTLILERYEFFVIIVINTTILLPK